MLEIQAQINGCIRALAVVWFTMMSWLHHFTLFQCWVCVSLLWCHRNENKVLTTHYITTTASTSHTSQQNTTDWFFCPLHQTLTGILPLDGHRRHVHLWITVASKIQQTLACKPEISPPPPPPPAVPLHVAPSPPRWPPAPLHLLLLHLPLALLSMSTWPTTQVTAKTSLQLLQGSSPLSGSSKGEELLFIPDPFLCVSSSDFHPPRCSHIFHRLTPFTWVPSFHKMLRCFHSLVF